MIRNKWFAFILATLVACLSAVGCAAQAPTVFTLNWTTAGMTSLPLIRVALQDGKSRLFIVDTKSQASLIDRTLAKEMKLSISEQEINGPGSAVDVAYTSANMGPDVLTIPAVPFVLMDLSSLRSGSSELAGIIGINFLDNFVVSMDYSKKQMKLAASLDDPDLRKQAKESKRFPIRDQRGRCVVDAELDSRTMEFILDTGNERTFLGGLVKDFPKPKGSLDGASAYVLAGQGRDISMHLLMASYFRMNRLAISGMEWKNPVMNWIGSVGGNSLGNDFFERFNVIFDFKGKALYLKRDPAFKDKAEEWIGTGA